ncbi:beta-glucanase [Diplogelasinospora grovesii]|uniref:Beta-glucanase n=1 Tax=Diplogelasinospora grovesii TaxID=303347 RepID=A0AAN6MYL7_9PEZI|nr:beta-glucanase [Diplogelasinospora grovesii]
MHFNAAAALLPLFSSLASAGAATNYPGFNVLWSDTFAGGAGSSVNSGLWNIAQSVHTNDEVEVYTGSNQNLQISGGGTVQFIPRKSPSGLWTSARIESQRTFTPQAGKVMMVEAAIRFGDNSPANKQGIWPAFWMLGDSIHHGTPWPQCGELDIMETVNGILTGYGTAHCGSFPGGTCNEPVGKAGTTGIPDNGWHTWSIKIDRTNSASYTTESISWLLDGNVYHTLTGAELGDEGVWATLAHSPLFIILNLAVGGDWPGAPNGATLDSYGSMMEVEYVAVYST